MDRLRGFGYNYNRLVFQNLSVHVSDHDGDPDMYSVSHVQWHNYCSSLALLYTIIIYYGTEKPYGCQQEYIRGGKESILLRIAVCKHPLKSTEVKLTSASITVMVTHPGV